MRPSAAQTSRLNRRRILCTAQLKGALWAARRVVNRRRKEVEEDIHSPLASIYDDEAPSNSNLRMTLTSISVEGGATKRKGVRVEEGPEEADYGCVRGGHALQRCDAWPLLPCLCPSQHTTP